MHLEQLYLVEEYVVLLVYCPRVGVVDDGQGPRSHVHPAAGQVLHTVLKGNVNMIFGTLSLLLPLNLKYKDKFRWFCEFLCIL